MLSKTHYGFILFTKTDEYDSFFFSGQNSCLSEKHDLHSIFAIKGNSFHQQKYQSNFQKMMGTYLNKFYFSNSSGILSFSKKTYNYKHILWLWDLKFLSSVVYEYRNLVYV